MFHQGKDYNQKYQDLLDGYVNSIEVDENLKEIIKDNFDFVISYKEDTIPDFVSKITEYLASRKSGKNAQKIVKTDARFSDVSTDDFGTLYKNTSKYIKKIDDVKKINTELRNRNDKSMMNLNNELHGLKEDVVSNLKIKYKNIFIIKKTESILSVIKGSVRKKTGKKSAIDNIGFANLIANRLKFMKKISKLKSSLASVDDKMETKKLGYLPQKGVITLVVNIITLSEGYTYRSGSVFNRNSITEYRDLVRKISNFTYGNFNHINNYFTPQDKDIKGIDFVSEVIKKESYIEREDGEKYEPSEGEKAILSISGLLENTEYDCYLFDEIERGLGNKYISSYLIPKLIALREKNKMIVISTHNANIATNTLPSQCIYCEYKNKTSNAYYFGDMYSGKLIGSIDSTEILDWEEKALEHLEGSQNMFNRRKNLYGIE